MAKLHFDGVAATASFDSVNNYWLVTPIPEPGALAAWMAAFAALFACIYRRRTSGRAKR